MNMSFEPQDLEVASPATHNTTTQLMQWDKHTGNYRKTMARMLKDSKFLFDSVS